MSRGNATNENTRRPGKDDSWEFNSIIAKLLSKFSCKKPTLRSALLCPLALSNLFCNYIKMSYKRKVYLKINFRKKISRYFMGYFEFFARFQNFYLLIYPIFSRGTLVGKRCCRGTGQNYNFTHYLRHKFAQFSTHDTSRLLLNSKRPTCKSTVL